MADETKKNPVDAVNEYSDKILSLYSTRFPFLKKYANGGFDSVKWLKVLMGLCSIFRMTRDKRHLCLQQQKVTLRLHKSY